MTQLILHSLTEDLFTFYLFSIFNTHLQLSLLLWIDYGAAPSQQLPFGVAMKGIGTSQKLMDEVEFYDTNYPNVKCVFQRNAFFDTPASLKTVTKMLEGGSPIPEGKFSLLNADNHGTHRQDAMQKLVHAFGYLWHFGPAGTTHVR